MASNVFTGNAQVRARDGGGYDVLVLDDVEPCLSVGIGSDGERLGTVLADCPTPMTPGRATATNGVETYLVRQTRDHSGTSHLVLGVVTYDLPHPLFGIANEGRSSVVEHPFEVPPGGPGGGAAEPALAPFGPDRFLLAWTEGGTIRAQPIWRWAEPAGSPVVIAAEDIADVGRPSIAFANANEALVAFAASTPTGFHILAVPVVCSL